MISGVCVYKTVVYLCMYRVLYWKLQVMCFFVVFFLSALISDICTLNDSRKKETVAEQGNTRGECMSSVWQAHI